MKLLLQGAYSGREIEVDLLSVTPASDYVDSSGHTYKKRIVVWYEEAGMITLGVDIYGYIYLINADYPYNKSIGSLWE